ncbi:kinase-like domain-containing protein [Cristinia sonorae]|uniref:Kinase-like domain-containing protein n=1 Tax=Cristinia sonorae TaxID=1940300 RepID=A0A8K0USR3_9AGAR|nr:kinase-like domain-containing protein [Cristinia sonorae]
MVDAFKAEIRKIEVLGPHPNIVEYLGFEETPTSLNIFVEYVPGGSIEDHVRKYGNYEVSLVRNVIAQILQGLQHRHSQGFIHGNLTPKKILAMSSSVYKISTLCLSCSVEETLSSTNALDDTSTTYVQASSSTTPLFRAFD